MRTILCILIIVSVVLGAIFALGQAPPSPTAAPTNAPSGTATNLGGANPPNTITVQLVQPPAQTQNATWETVEAVARYVPAAIALVVAIIALYQVRMGARYTYASEIMKFRLRQIQEFYAPALLLIEESQIVYKKLLWTITKEKPEFSLDDFRLLDHMYLKDEKNLKPLIERILETGKKLTKLISAKSGLIEGGLTPTFIEYLAHFAILNAASEQELTQAQKDGWHEFVYYPRMLNREIHEGFKVILKHLENYVNAGDKIICKLLGQKPVEIGKYRRLLLDNLGFYEKHASEYATKFDTFDMSPFRQRFIDAIESTRNERPANLPTDTISILDNGCGTGRDTYEFLKKGYVVTAIDASPAMLRQCRRKIRKARSEPEGEQMKKAAEASEERCLEMTFDEISFRNEFDGVWAAASLLHVPSEQMEENLRKLVQALKPNGILFMSFKYGHGEYESEPRSYTYYSQRGIRAHLRRIHSTKEIRVWFSDATGKDLSRRKRWRAWILKLFGRYDRSLWLNVMVKRQRA